MATYPTPSPKQLREAFNDHRVNWREGPGCSDGRSAWIHGLRAATVHHTAGKDSAAYLSSFTYGGANTCVTNGHYNASDGVALILSWGDCWHSGDGGPWPGVAARNSLHLVSWGIEIESMGVRRDITEAQMDTVGKMLASLVDLGMPKRNIHRHADWTDGTGPVGGYPLATVGRKIDTRADLGYTTEFWKEQAGVWLQGEWDGQTPSIQDVLEGGPRALWRLQARLYDLGYRKSRPVRPDKDPRFPKQSLIAFQAKQGWEGSGVFNTKTQKRLFGEEKP